MNDVIGYPDLSLGLNNQKIALFGLFSKAQIQNRPLTLPLFCNFNAASGSHELVPLSHAYSVDHLKRFAAAFNVEIIDGPPAENDNGWDCFIAGCSRHSGDVKRGPGHTDDFTGEFFRNLVPVVAETDTFKTLHHEVFVKRGVQIVLQMRIENDWAIEAEKLHDLEQPFEDEYDLSYRQIIAKLKNTFDDSVCRIIYVVSDEANLPVQKHVIQDAVRQEFGISLIWKSDILSSQELETLSLLAKSTLDFEMAVGAPIFVGFSRSTFSNFVNFEAFCRQRASPQHYIYNNPGSTLLLRHDRGSGVAPHEIADRLISRPALIDHTNCPWPATLIAHLANWGDFITTTGSTNSALVAGIRNNGSRVIEGFSVKFETVMPGSFEYRARRADGSWTGWIPEAGFAGTRSQNQALTGFAARLTGPMALTHDCLSVGSFQTQPDLVIAKNGEACIAKNQNKLEAMQLAFRSRTSS